MHEGRSSSRSDGTTPLFRWRRSPAALWQLNEIAVSDRTTLECLTQFPSCRRACASKRLQRRHISHRVCVKGVLRHPDRPQLVDSKAEKCRSGRSSPFGTRLRRLSPSNTETLLCAVDSGESGRQDDLRCDHQTDRRGCCTTTAVFPSARALRISTTPTTRNGGERNPRRRTWTAGLR